MLIGGRRIVPWILHQVARAGSRELFTLAVLAIVQYVVVALLQGPVAVSKGMMLFAFYYDATLVGAIAIVVDRLLRRRNGSARIAASPEGQTRR